MVASVEGRVIAVIASCGFAPSKAPLSLVFSVIGVLPPVLSYDENSPLAAVVTPSATASV